MKFKFTLLVILIFILKVDAQTPYFQQKVDYNIDVKLDDEAHSLQGKAVINYTNNSPKALTEIYFHLWGNAYKSKNSAFAKQKIRTGDTGFYFANKDQMGGYSEIDFFINKRKPTWEYDKKNKDIAKVTLLVPLDPGETLEISVPFTLIIPESFSRLGHVKTSYQMTQWYPKPAVYDQDGWHPMPYLDMGEFYSEFGKFDVKITLPKNYVVASTGILQTESEINFLNKKVRETQSLVERGFETSLDFPKSSNASKTIQFTAENVHDFAWFADKRFHVLKDQAILDNGKTIDTWAFFTNQQAKMWTRGAEYCKRAVKHYSNLVGDYPWPHATAVQSALSAGAGMEYPMITVIGKAGNAKALDRVITHEVGHNWFYGILANNERTHPWFDEGLNTYYENRYMVKFYESDDEVDLPKFATKGSKMGVNELACLYQDCRHMDQAPDTHSNEMTSLNYGLAAYVKPGRALRLLEKYIGQADFDLAMKTYFDEWNMKHPQPEDFKKSLESSTGKKLDWLFEGLLFSNKKSDFVLSAINSQAGDYELKIHNHGELSTPFPVSGVKDGEVIKTVWFDGIKGDKVVNFPKGNYDKIVIDPEYHTLDINRTNNQVKTSGIFKSIEPIQFALLGGIPNPEKTRINYLPALGYNLYDGLMLGAAFYSNPIPAKTFEYHVAPMYAFRRGGLSGLANFRYQKFNRTSKIHRWAIDLGLKSFGYNYNETYEQFSAYRKIAPKITVDLRKSSPTAHNQISASLRSVIISQDFIRGVSAADGIFVDSTVNYMVNELKFTLENDKVTAPRKINFTIQQGKGFVKAFTNIRQEFLIDKKGKKFKINLFGGYLNRSDNYTSPPRVGFQINDRVGFEEQHRDYLFDELHFGRSSRDTGFFAHQLFGNREANLKSIAVTTSATGEWMLGLGLRSGIPNPIPIEPYVDIAVFPKSTLGTSVYYSAGIAIPVIQNVFEIYVPILENRAITSGATYEKHPGFFQRISFKLDLNKLNAWKLANNFNL